jgi:hypothetical protein
VIERVIQKVLRRQPGEPPTPCPDAETLAAYVDRLLTGPSVHAVEDHLSNCETCLDQVILCTPTLEVAAHGPRFDVVVRFLEHAAEIVRGLAEIRVLPAPALVPTRNTREDRPTLKCVRFDRQFDGLTVEVEVEASIDGLGEIRVEPSADGAIAEDIRVTLLDDRRELDSSLARGGNVSFDGVEFGDYVIRLSRRGRTIGEVTLRLETG